jgi:hypothetical protein
VAEAIAVRRVKTAKEEAMTGYNKVVTSIGGWYYWMHCLRKYNRKGMNIEGKAK